MSAQGTPAAPAGWYSDPQNPTQGRYWDGSSWTELRHVPGQPFPAPPPLTAPPGTDWNTVWIWLIIALPVVPVLLLLFVPWGSMFDFDPTDPRAATAASFGIFLSPFYWASVVLGYLGYGLSVFFAYRDVKQLQARGVPKPFHWAFAFIGGVVYTIGRSVVVKRRTGRGHAPLWAEVAVFLLTTALVVWIEVVIFTSMGDLFRTIPGYYR